MTPRSAATSPLIRAASSERMVDGTGTRSSSSTAIHFPFSCLRWPSSTSIATNSSTKSGLPSAEAAMRSLIAPADESSPSRFAISSTTRSPDRGARSTVVARSFPPAQPGRVSRSSGRATHTKSIGKPRDQSATWSTMSRKADSAQWMSSNTTTNGRLSANSSKKRRADHITSSLVGAPSDKPIAAAQVPCHDTSVRIRRTQLFDLCAGVRS